MSDDEIENVGIALTNHKDKILFVLGGIHNKWGLSQEVRFNESVEEGSHRAFFEGTGLAITEFDTYNGDVHVIGCHDKSHTYRTYSTTRDLVPSNDLVAKWVTRAQWVPIHKIDGMYANVSLQNYKKHIKVKTAIVDGDGFVTISRKRVKK